MRLRLSTTVVGLVMLRFMQPTVAVGAEEEAWKALLDDGKRLGQQGDYQGAERSFLSALREAEAFGAKDPRVADTLNLLGLTYIGQQRGQEAQTVLTRALAIREEALGISHTDTSATRTNLAHAFAMEDKIIQAEQLYQRTIVEIERSGGPYSPELDNPLTSLSTLYLLHGRAVQAEPLARRALAISERAQGSEGLRVQENLHQLASILAAQQKYSEAVTVASRALVINRKVLGQGHLQVGISLQILGQIHEVIQGCGKRTEGGTHDFRAITWAASSVRGRHSSVLCSCSAWHQP